MPTIDATVYPDEAYVLVQTDWSGTILRDTFGRVAAQTWEPAADTGQVWQVQSGAAADFPVNGFQGVIIHAAAGTTKRLLSPIVLANARATGFFTNFVSPTGPPGADFTYQAMLRFVDINNLVDVRFVIASTGTVSVILRQRIAAVDTTTTVVTTLPTSGVYGWTFEARGSLLAARIWMASNPEPLTWNATLATTFLTAGAFVTGTVIAAGVTNPLPVTFWVDNITVEDLDATTGDCAIVTRRNTVTGEVIQLRPYVFYNGDGALMLECGQGLWWDTEPPLNVPLEYCTFACDSFVTISSNPDFDTSTTGWTTSGGATLTQDCTVAKVGTCSGRITPDGVSGLPSIFQAGIPLVAGRPVVASTWAMSPQGWNTVILRLFGTYSDLTTFRLETERITLDDNEWRYLSLSFTPTLPVASATLQFVAGGIPPNTTLFNVDDIKVTQSVEVLASACETVTVESDSVWLKNPLHPCLDVEVGLCNPMLNDCEQDSRVSYAGTSTQSYAPNSVLLTPANRRRLLPINRVRRDAGATLALIAHDCDAKDAILAINEPGDPLLFQAPADYCIPDRYITVGVEEEGYIGRDQRDDFRLMLLPYETTDRPEGPADGPCGTRIDDLCDIYSSWGALALSGLTWTDLLLGLASPDGPGQPAPPAAARDWDEVEAEFVDWDDVEAGGTRDWDELRDGL